MPGRKRRSPVAVHVELPPQPWAETGPGRAALIEIIASSLRRRAAELAEHNEETKGAA